MNLKRSVNYMDISDEPTLSKMRLPHQAGPQWSSWNAYAPEVEFCEFAASLITLMKPDLVLETGLGEGYVTRRTVPQMLPSARYVCYELEKQFRTDLAETRYTVLDGLVGYADLTILDSVHWARSEEIRLWWEISKPSAVLLLHDATFKFGECSHSQYSERVVQLGIPGVWFDTHYGAFLGQKPPVLEIPTPVQDGHVYLRS